MFGLVPRCQVSRSRDVHPCYYGLALSSLALSTPAIWCRIVRSRDVQFRVFSRPSNVFSDNFGTIRKQWSRAISPILTGLQSSA